MARLLPTVLVIPTFGTYGLDTPVSSHETLTEGFHSDSEDDSARPSQPSGWDGWHGTEWIERCRWTPPGGDPRIYLQALEAITALAAPPRRGP
jgi:hypothetical protein